MRSFNNIKLSIYNNKRIVIENYDEIKEITETEIIVDEYKIQGEFLKIRQMNDFIIEISGCFKTIIVSGR